MLFFTYRKFKECLHALTDNDENFTDNRQKDVGEFLSKLLTFVDEEYLKQNFGKISPIEKNFGIRMQKIQICEACGEQSINNNFHKGFICYSSSLDIQENQMLIDILENVVVPEEQLLDCNFCCSRTNHQVNYKWVMPPPCMVIVIRRYFFNPTIEQAEKNPCLVFIPKVLNM